MKYDAFISYRHAELDLHIAKNLHKGLETYKVPRAVARKSGKKNIKRVFRDQEELPIGSDLGDNIETALTESEFLIVVCSPRTPESYWVRKEIETFIKLHDREHVLAVLIEGEPDQSFPAELLTDDEGNPVEPLAADVRGGSRREINRKLKTEVVRLAAPLLGCSYDDLRQRHRERKIKRAASALAAVTVAAILFGLYSTYNAVMIQQNYEGKQRNQSKYLADTSLDLLEEGDRRAAVLVALEALPGEEGDKPYAAEAQYALSQALYCYDGGHDLKPDRILRHDQPVSDFWLSQDAAMAVTIDQGNNVYVWDVNNGKKLLQIAPTVDNAYDHVNEVKGAIICEDRVILCENWSLRAVSLDGQEKWRVDKSEWTLRCKFDEEAMIAACVGSDQVDFYNMSSGELVGSMPNEQETSYSLAMAFNKEHTKFAVSHQDSKEGSKAGCISIYDFETREVTSVETTANSISAIAFTTDGYLAAASLDINELLDFDMASAGGYIEKINDQDGEVLWQNTYEYQIIGYESSSAQLRCRSYTEKGTGQQHDEVLMSIDNTAYTWDNATGDLIAQVRTDSGIDSFLAAADNGLAYLAGSNGTIDIADMTTGYRYSAFAIQTNSNLRDVSIKNSVMAVRAFASPGLKIFRYHKNPGKTELKEYESSISSVQVSPAETYYAVSAYDPYLKILFYRTQDNKLVDMWTNVEEKVIADCEFVEDTIYVITCSDGSLYFCDLESGEKETLNEISDFRNTECCFDKRKSKAFLYSNRQYAVIDLKQREIMTAGETEGFIWGAILGEDGKNVYCSIKGKGVCVLDLETGNTDQIEVEGYQVLNGANVEKSFAASGDGKLLAVNCQDYVIRVLNLEKMTTIAEIPFSGVNRRMIKFSEDCRQIMMQGDDYYFRVYDLEKKEFTHVSLDQYNEIREILAAEGQGTISLLTSSDMIILNRNDYERIAQIEGGRAYLPENARILCGYLGQLYQLPYMTLEMLREEAQVQFWGEELTELEKTRFHVE